METTKQPSRRGFASLSPKERSRVASMGGQAVQRSGKAHRWTSEEAQIAGRKGGAISRRRSRYFKEEL